MKNTSNVDYIIQTNFGDFIGERSIFPTKLGYVQDPNMAAHWDTMDRAARVAESINNRFIAETSIKRGSDIRVAVVCREVRTSYKLINEFPKI